MITTILFAGSISHRGDNDRCGFSIVRLWCVFWIFVAFASRETRQSSVIIVRDDECDPCYRKLMTGKRLADSHVRRNVQCNRIEDCHRVCEYESTFVCEGFNYGRVHNADSTGHRPNERSYSCQLTSLSSTGMDHRRDFVQDPRYDYYQRDWRCPASKPVQGSTGWLNYPARPSSWRPPSSQNSPNEIPKRPQRPNDRYPGFPASGNTDTRYYLPERPGQTFDRPNNYDYHSGPSNFLPQRPENDVVGYPRPSNPVRPRPYLPNPDYHYPGSYAFEMPYGTKFPDRRYDQSGWGRPQLESRPNEVLPDRDWPRPIGHYLPAKNWLDSGVYGSSYGYDSNRFDGRPPDGPGGDRPGHYYPGYGKPKPLTPSKRPGDLPIHPGNHYGPAYGYDGQDQHVRPIDSYVPNWKPQHHGPHGGWGGSRDCSVRSATGFKIVRGIVDASYTVANLEECEMLCAARRDCRSFAYRYSLAATAPTDNCLLTTLNFSKLHFYTDIEPDRDYDIYAIVGDLRNCQVSKKVGTEPQSNQRLPEECFWRMKSGFGLPGSMTRKELRVDHGLGECEIACVSVREFTCRSFVFRYDSDRDPGPNCFLSDCPSNEIISEHGSRLPRVDQAELYERGSYGRGCEPYPFATIYNPANFDKPKPWTGANNNVGNGAEEGCYSGYQGGCKLSPYAVSSITRVDSETECRRKCSRMRNNPHSPCMSFSFKIGDEKRGDNCYLSDVPRKDLRPGLDYVYDDDYVMYAWKELEPQCSLFPIGYPPNGGFHNDFAGGGSDGWSGGSSTDGRPPPIGPGNGFFTYNHLVLGVRPLDSDRPDPVGPPDHSSQPPTPQNHDDHSFGIGPFDHGFASFNRHYTVNGLPCKRGTKCERNQLVGFWSCEPEGSDMDSWDYCCEPNHHCGYSQGYRYPWCYVGPSEDQWRPCSDKYFPYLPSPRPAIPPNQPDPHRPSHQPSGQYVANEDSTTYHSRHWPIAFIHPQPPPNTTDSVALADDRRDDAKHTNQSNDQPPLFNKTRAASVKTPDSPITHVQLHKSHLKRRGLVPVNGSRLFSKYGAKKIRRIAIVPADRGGYVGPKTPSYDTPWTTEKSLEFMESGYENETASSSMTNGGSEVVRLGAMLSSVGVGGKKRKGILGRVERVTMPAKTITVHSKGRGTKNDTHPDVDSNEFDIDSTDKSSVNEAVRIQSSNDSSQDSRNV